MKKILSLTLVIALIVILFVASSFIPFRPASKNNQSKIRVMVTIPPQAEFVKKVGGERVQVTVMVPPGYNPHTYEPKPSQLKEVEKAEIYFALGSGIDFEVAWLSKLQEINRKMLVVNCSEGVQMIDRDPHIWLSPRNVEIMVGHVYEGLVQVDPANEKYYRENLEAYLQELDVLNREIEALFSNVTNRIFIAYHPSWGYFARDYNLTQIPIEKEGKEPTAASIAALIEQAKRLNVKVVVVSPQFNVKSAEVVAEEIGGKIVLADPLAEDYVNNLRSVALRLSEAMS
ncbi:MAG: zinc ABC transporter substrate-binding protein [Candidatus Wolframiiraptor sp.]|nr:MAG: zinc ABC transporter substrate-binding protein [Candidatus Wolframiiraptor sp.]